MAGSQRGNSDLLLNQWSHKLSSPLASTGEGLDAPQTLQADPTVTQSSSSESTSGVLAMLGFSR